VTTIMGPADEANAQGPAVRAFERTLNIWPLCLSPIPLSEQPQSTTRPPTADAVRLFAGNSSELLELDLLRGALRSWQVPAGELVTGLAAVDDGARVFVTTVSSAFEMDTRTGAFTDLWKPRPRGTTVSGPAVSFGSGLAVDRVGKALVFCDYTAHTILRLTGIRL
jgi:hypothetical protein